MTIYGPDFSHYDTVPSGARVVSEGFSFMTHKAGGDANDAELDEWWSALKGQRGKLLLGTYWVLRPDLSGTAVNKADAYLARLDGQCPGWRDGPWILQVDCESWGDSSGKKKPNKAYIKAFCDRLVAKMPKLRPIVYASKGDYGDSLTGLTYPLWNARYSLSDRAGTASGLYAAALAAGSGWGSYSGQVPAIWQYTSSATIVGQTTCDANAYRGTLQQLTALTAPGWEDDVATQDDILAALKTFFASGYQDTAKTILTSQIGRDAFNQGVPNPFIGSTGKSTAWALLSDIADALIVQGADLDALKAQVAALNQTAIPQAQLDLAVLNALKTLAGGQA
jgi:GH25 family lysozyme M1 (1,4-beta-N-acetylmuramidase)